jgi:hypothetical protein
MNDGACDDGHCVEEEEAEEKDVVVAIVVIDGGITIGPVDGDVTKGDGVVVVVVVAVATAGDINNIDCCD